MYRLAKLILNFGGAAAVDQASEEAEQRRLKVCYRAAPPTHTYASPPGLTRAECPCTAHILSLDACMWQRMQAKRRQTWYPGVRASLLHDEVRPPRCALEHVPRMFTGLTSNGPAQPQLPPPPQTHRARAVPLVLDATMTGVACHRLVRGRTDRVGVQRGRGLGRAASIVRQRDVEPSVEADIVEHPDCTDAEGSV